VVGIISDSFENQGSIEDDVATGDLPADTIVVADAAGGESDEGRAMAQLVHDTAPGAGIRFHYATSSQAGFADAIDSLIEAGATVVVDDIIFPAEPAFQDGVIAKKVDEVFAAGTPYFATAGNEARDAHYDTFRAEASPGGSAIYHNFDASGNGEQLTQTFTLGPDASVSFFLHWDEPLKSTGGAGPARQLFIEVDGVTDDISTDGGGFDDVIGISDPLQGVTVTNDNTNGESRDFTVSIYADVSDSKLPPTAFKYFIFRSGELTLESTNGPKSGTLVGHANTDGSCTIGASAYKHFPSGAKGGTPPFGTSPPQINTFRFTRSLLLLITYC
jgi:hypothetical protein